MQEDECVIMEIEVDAKLAEELAEKLSPMGLTIQEYLEMLLNFTGDQTNEAQVMELLTKWKEETLLSSDSAKAAMPCTKIGRQPDIEE